MLGSGITLAKPYSWCFRDKTVALIKVLLQPCYSEDCRSAHCLPFYSVYVKTVRVHEVIIVRDVSSSMNEASKIHDTLICLMFSFTNFT